MKDAYEKEHADGKHVDKIKIFEKVGKCRMND